MHRSSQLECKHVGSYSHVGYMYICMFLTTLRARGVLCIAIASYTANVKTSNLGVHESVVQCVAREDGRLAVDVVQRYLYSGQRSNACVDAAKGENDCIKERRAVITVVDRRIDLAVGPLAGVGGGCLNQTNNR